MSKVGFSAVRSKVSESSARAKIPAAESPPLVVGSPEAPAKPTPTTRRPLPLVVTADFPPHSIGIQQPLEHLSEQGSKGKSSGKG